MWICCKLRSAHWSHSQSRFTENYLHASVDLTRFDFLLLKYFFTVLLTQSCRSSEGAQKIYRGRNNLLQVQQRRTVFFPLNLILDFFLCSVVYLTLKRNNIFETTFLRVLHKVHERATALKHFLCFLPASHTQ